MEGLILIQKEKSKQLQAGASSNGKNWSGFLETKDKKGKLVREKLELKEEVPNRVYAFTLPDNLKPIRYMVHIDGGYRRTLGSRSLTVVNFPEFVHSSIYSEQYVCALSDIPDLASADNISIADGKMASLVEDRKLPLSPATHDKRGKGFPSLLHLAAHYGMRELTCRIFDVHHNLEDLNFLRNTAYDTAVNVARIANQQVIADLISNELTLRELYITHYGQSTYTGQYVIGAKSVTDDAGSDYEEVPVVAPVRIRHAASQRLPNPPNFAEMQTKSQTLPVDCHRAFGVMEEVDEEATKVLCDQYELMRGKSSAERMKLGGELVKKLPTPRPRKKAMPLLPRPSLELQDSLQSEFDGYSSSSEINSNHLSREESKNSSGRNSSDNDYVNVGSLLYDNAVEVASENSYTSAPDMNTQTPSTLPRRVVAIPLDSPSVPVPPPKPIKASSEEGHLMNELQARLGNLMKREN